MPDSIPASSLAAAEAAIIKASADFGHGDMVCGSSREFARAALEAAAPLLAEAWGVAAPKPGTTRDPRAGITCRRCGAGPGQQCVTASGARAPMVHAERRNDWRRAEGQTTGLESEGRFMNRFPPRPAPSAPVTPVREDEGS